VVGPIKVSYGATQPAITRSILGAASIRSTDRNIRPAAFLTQTNDARDTAHQRSATNHAHGKEPTKIAQHAAVVIFLSTLIYL